MKATTKYAALVCIAAGLAGCAGMTTQERDTVVGAGVGTAAGAALTGDVGGAVVGGVVGGVVGHEVGRH
jgi:osmotically inducible lipoprotein OsmB